MNIDTEKALLRELVRIQNYNLTACGYEALTIDGTVKKLASVPTDAKYAEITLESSIAGKSIRYLELGGTGTQPSTTVGIAKQDLDMFDIHGQHNIINARFTQISAGTHTIHVQYYK